MGDKKKWELIKLGWDRLDDKTKTRLKNLGIRDLQHTPGTLINPRGYIPGAVGAFGTVSGKLSMTGDIAEKNMGFRPKEGAIGVNLSRRKYVDENGKVKNGIFAISLMPWQATPTEKQKPVHEYMTVLSKIASKHISDLIHPIWEPLVINKSRKPWTGYHYFISLNIKKIGTALHWRNLLISNGKLEPPKESFSNWYDPRGKRIHIIVPRTIKHKPITINQVGIGIFDAVTGDFLHIPPSLIANFLEEKAPDIAHYSGTSAPTWKAGTLELTWRPKKVRNYYYHCELSFGKEASQFYIYTYYKREGSVRSSRTLRQCKFDTGQASLVRDRRELETGTGEFLEETRDKSSSTHNSIYSPSLSARIRVFQNRTNRTNGIPIVISIIEQPLQLPLPFSHPVNTR